MDPDQRDRKTVNPGGSCKLVLSGIANLSVGPLLLDGVRRAGETELVMLVSWALKTILYPVVGSDQIFCIPMNNGYKRIRCTAAFKLLALITKTINICLHLEENYIGG